MSQRNGNALRFGDRYPFFWLYAVAFFVVAATAAALSFPAGRIGVGAFAAVAAAVATPRKYAVALPVAGSIVGFSLVPVIAIQGVALVIPAAVLGLTVLAIIKRARSLRAPRGLLAMTLFFGLFMATTALFSRTTSPLLVVLLLGAAAIPVLFMAANMNSRELRVVSVVVFALLGAQLVLAYAEATGVIEPLYDFAAKGEVGLSTQENTIVSGWARATGTMLHALPLGFLSITSAGLVTLRTEAYRWSLPVRVLVILMAAATCVFASARSSLIVLALVVLVTLPARGRIARFAQIGLIITGAGMFLISSGFFESRQVVDLMSSGSVVHRLGVVSMLPMLYREPLLNLIFGNGHDAANLLEHLMPNDGWLTADNQFISAILMTGIVGFGLLLYVLARAWRSAREWRHVLMAQVAMFAIFDVLLWQSSLVLIMLVLGCMLAKPEAEPEAPAPVPRKEHERGKGPVLQTRHR